MKKNDCISLSITGLGNEGNGIGRYDGMAVFVPQTAPGDEILARIVKVQKQYAFGIVQEMVKPSPDRIANDCPVYAQCGGCCLRHLSYPAELAVKADWVAQNLRRIGGIDLALAPIIPSPSDQRYRNKAQFPVRLVNGKICAGFFAPRSHRIVPVEDCLLQPLIFRSIVQSILSFMEDFSISPYDEQNHTGLVRHIFIRLAETTGQVMVYLILNGNTLPHHDRLIARLQDVCPQLASFGIDANRHRTNKIWGGNPQLLFGSDTITDTLRGIALDISPLSFYQVNRGAAERLLEVAADYATLSPDDHLLDLYCGTGAVGLSMARSAGALVGVEVVAAAVENARHNALQNGIKHARFLCADAACAAQQLLADGWHPDVIVLDPPRKGADAAVLDCIAALAPSRVVYISCNSATLARDVKLLAQQGYHLRKARPVDLFPRTANVECCALFTRAEPAYR